MFISASAVGYYGSTGLGLCYEDSPAGHDFLAEVCIQWEVAVNALELTATRRVIMRLGTVLDLHGGIYPPLAKLTKEGSPVGA